MIHSKQASILAHGCLAALLATLCSCGGGSDPPPDLVASVVRQYAVLLDANYKDAIAEMDKLAAKVDEFLAAPSADGLAAAQQAWLDARKPYGACEVSRFYGGPMDAAQGAMNEWPIDENTIDYTAGNPNGGIINDSKQFPEITAPLLASLAQRGGIENYATGYHAVEFLLWGQRLDQMGGPGERPHTDFVDGGTASNQARRRTYLATIMLMLLETLRSLEAEWNLSDPKSYGAKFVAADPHQSLTKIYRGFSQMAIAETLYERLSNPLRSRDRKDEQSCFSESTLADLSVNALGVENVYLGHYGKLEGPGISDLILAKNADLDRRMQQRLTLIRTAIDAIPPPLDHAILADPLSEPNMTVQAAVDAFVPLFDLLHEGSDALGVVNNL